MQDDPRYDDVVSEVKAFLEERLAFAVSRGGPRGARLPRPRDRLREDGRAQPRARAPPRRAGRDRTAGARRLLAQEHAGADPGRPGRRRSGRRRRRWARRSLRTSAERRSCGCTTSASTSRRCAVADGGVRRMKVELRGLELYGYHGVHAEERERGQRFLVRRRARGRRPRRGRPARGRGRLLAGRESGARGRRDALQPARGARDGDRGRARASASRPERLKRAGAEARRAPGRDRRRVRSGHGRTVTLAYVGLGANLGDREASIRRAAELIGARRLSTIVETEPWGITDQPDFLNAVAEVETDAGAARASRPAARGRAGARPRARREALGAADDRPRPAPLRDGDIRRPRAPAATPAAPRAAVRPACRSPSSRPISSFPARGPWRIC